MTALKHAAKAHAMLIGNMHAESIHGKLAQSVAGVWWRQRSARGKGGGGGGGLQLVW